MREGSFLRVIFGSFSLGVFKSEDPIISSMFSVQPPATSDNVFVERLWRSVKYEDVYLRAYATPTELRVGLDRYFKFYNTKRRHSALDRRTPDAVYFDLAGRTLAA